MEKINHNQVLTGLSQLKTIISKADAIEEAKANESSADRDLISGIFVRLQSACPAWKQSLAGLGQDEAQQVFNQAKRDWLNAFMENQINDMRLINYAFSRLLATPNPFMPTVGEFIAWCREGAIPEGTKNTLQAYKEVCAYQCLPREKRLPSTLSQETWHTLSNLGDLAGWRHMEKMKHKKYWDEEFEVTIEKLRNGEPLDIAPEPRAAIERIKTPLDKENAISQLRAMRESIKL
jgi:hypothetical protein